MQAKKLKIPIKRTLLIAKSVTVIITGGEKKKVNKRLGSKVNRKPKKKSKKDLKHDPKDLGTTNLEGGS